jgi:putative ABC transport system permease protein
MLDYSLRAPRRFLRGNRPRLALTVLALTLGVGGVCAGDLVSRAALHAFVSIIDTVAGRAALQVRAGEGGLFPEGVARAMAAVPGVERTVPLVTGTAFTADESGELLSIHGMEIADARTTNVYELRDSRGRALSDPKLLISDAVVVTRTFADQRGMAVGSPLVLDTSKGRQTFIVRGLLQSTGLARVYGGNLVVMDLPAAQEAFARPGFVNQVDVVVQREADLASVADAIARVLPVGLRVEAPSQRKADLHKVMRSFQIILQALSVMAIGAAFLIAFSGLSTLFEARAWQLGVQRAIGMRQRAVWRELVQEGLLLGVGGIATGIPFGIALGHLSLPAITNAATLNAHLIAPDAHLTVQPASLALAAALGLGAALLAAALPAWRAARVEVIDTIRRRGVEQPGASAQFRWAVLGLVAAGIAAAITLQELTHSASWGLLATALLGAATTLVPRPLIDLLMSPLLRGLRWFTGPTASLSIKNISQNPRRTALTTAVLAVGLACVFWLWMVGHSFEQSVIEAVTGAMRADLVVGSSHIEFGYREAPVDSALVSDVSRIPGVAAVVGERVLEWPHANDVITIDSYDPQYFTSQAFGQWPLLGRGTPDMWDAVARGEAVVVSSNFLRNLKARIGDTLTLETPSGPLSLPIVGVVTHFASARGTIEVSRTVYEQFWHDGKVTRAFVRIAPATDAAAVHRAIASKLGRKYSLRILSSGELVQYFAKQVRRAFAGLYIVAFFVLCLVLVGMGDTLLAGVMERTREIGTLRAVGVHRRDVQRIVLIEGLALGVLGLIVALAGGFAMGKLWVDATFPALLGWVLTPYIPFARAAIVAVVTLAVCFIAALLPSRRASRLDPVVALRYE